MSANIISVKCAELQPGMQIAEMLATRFNTKLVTKGTILDESLIVKIRDAGIEKVSVYDLSQAQVEDNRERFVEEYKENLNEVKSFFSELDSSSIFKIDKIRGIVSTTLESSIANRDVIHSLNSVRGLDDYTYVHSMNVGILSSLIAKWSRWSEDDIKKITYAGLLHDIGKIRVPQHILNKPGKLTPEEFEQIKQHPIYAFDMLKKADNLSSDIKQAVLTHHEREDGSGYPLGLTGDKIHPYAKVLAIADVFDAMVSDRCYHAKDSPFAVFEFFVDQCLNKLDPGLLNTFVINMAPYYTGEKVLLSNGQEAEVIFVDPRNVSRPLVKVREEIINLAQNRTLTIQPLK